MPDPVLAVWRRPPSTTASAPYLALNNMLTLAGDHMVVTRLLAMSRDELGRWLDAVDVEGSVMG